MIIECDGYSTLGGTLNPKYSSNAISQSSSSSSASAVTLKKPTLHNFDRDGEMRCFEFFRERTSPQLAGFFPSEFWSTLILREALHEPIIKHAVLALGSLHERFSVGDGSILNPIWDKGEGGFALAQYNQAIQHLVKPGRKAQQAVDVCLIACMLFSSFETLRGHHGSALSHIRSGVKILLEIDENEDSRNHQGGLIISPYPYVELPTLELLFNRLDFQISTGIISQISSMSLDIFRPVYIKVNVLTIKQMIGTLPMRLRNKPSEKAPGFCTEIPTTFSSLEEARNSMDYQWNTAIQLLGDIEPHDTYEELKRISPHLEASRRAFSVIVRKWLAAFQALLQRKEKSFDSKSLQAARTLEINQIFMTIYLDIGTFDVLTDETIWDNFTSRYEHIVELASLIVGPTVCDHISQKQGPEFSLDMNIVAPLYAVAHRCRNPVIRRKAVSLLYAAPRQEGVWESILTARVAERLIGIEESGLGTVTCAEDVPDWARLSNVDVKFDHQGCLGTVSFTRQRSRHDKVREGVMETFSW